MIPDIKTSLSACTFVLDTFVKYANNTSFMKNILIFPSTPNRRKQKLYFDILRTFALTNALKAFEERLGILLLAVNFNFHIICSLQHRDVIHFH